MPDLRECMLKRFSIGAGVVIHRNAKGFCCPPKADPPAAERARLAEPNGKSHQRHPWSLPPSARQASHSKPTPAPPRRGSITRHSKPTPTPPRRGSIMTHTKSNRSPPRRGQGWVLCVGLSKCHSGLIQIRLRRRKPAAYRVLGDHAWIHEVQKIIGPTRLGSHA